MITLKRILPLSIVAISVSLVSVVSAQTGRERSTKKMQAAAKQSAQAARVFDAIMGTREKSIPRDLLRRAEAVAVFPGVLKGGFIVGGRRGSGVISRRVKSGWSAPAFFDLTGGSFGLQIGAASTDYILLFMNEEAVESLLGDKFEIGGEAIRASRARVRRHHGNTREVDPARFVAARRGGRRISRCTQGRIHRRRPARQWRD